MKAYKLEDIDAFIRGGIAVKVVAIQNLDDKGERLIQKGNFYMITGDDKGNVYTLNNITDMSNVFTAYQLTAYQWTAKTAEKINFLKRFISSSMLRYENQIVQCVMNESVQIDKNSVEELKQIEGINIIYASRFITAFEVETRLLPKTIEAVNELSALEIHQGQKSIASLDIDIDFTMYDFYHNK